MIEKLLSAEKIVSLALELARKQSLDRVIVARQIYATLAGDSAARATAEVLAPRAFHLADVFIEEARRQSGGK